MTLIVLEGASASGKSTVRDILADDHPDWVMWKGENLMRKGVGDSWVDYRERYHEALHRLYELNPRNVILADRGFSDAVYNSDEQKREEFRRLAACYGNVFILYFYPGELKDEFKQNDVENIYAHLTHDHGGREVLFDRESRDAPKMSKILNRYTKLLKMFPYEHINTGELSEEEAAGRAEAAINEFLSDYEHNPDV